MDNKILTIADVVQAVQFAEIAHSHQVDKNGLPYIRHPISVMNRVVQAGYTQPIFMITAVLHDTVEDTSAMISDLMIRFGIDVARAVDSVTRMVNPVTKDNLETYREFVLRAMLHPVGRVVKFHDIQDNMDPKRAVKDKARHLTERYVWALNQYRNRPSGIAGLSLYDHMTEVGF